MPMHDFKCEKCEEIFEELVPIIKNEDGTEHVPTTVTCECGAVAHRIFTGAPKQLTKIIPSYPGCLKNKAGYVHSHGDKPAKKLQSGYGGVTKPS